MMRTLLLAAFGLSGAAALMYEVVWSRALALVLGSTTYAVSTMLSAFMAGLALGGYVGGRIADNRERLVPIFAALELGVGVFGMLTIWIVNALPPLYFSIFKGLHIAPTAYFAIQFLLCFAVMLVPTTFMGATFPIVSKAITSDFDQMGRGVGNAYSFNTIGAVLGSFLAGFVFIPWLGLEKTTVLAACLNTAAAVLVLVFSRARIDTKVAGGIGAALLIAATAALASESHASTMGFYKAARFDSYAAFLEDRARGETLFHRWYREGQVRLWRDEHGFLVLEHGGRVEGSGPTDITNTALIAYLPIAAHGAPESFLGIGLGTGFTLAAAKEHVDDVDVVEINGGVIEAMRRFGPPDLFDGVETHAADGRHFVAMTDERFDIIASQPSYPTDAGAGNLFTREYYELAAAALTSDGVYCQWLPYYALSNDDVTMMLRTFASVFPEVVLYKIEHSLDLIMVGRRSPFSLTGEEILARVAALNIRDLPLPVVLSRTPEQVKEIVARESHVPLNTDDHPILEFHAAVNYMTDFKEQR